MKTCTIAFFSLFVCLCNVNAAFANPNIRVRCEIDHDVITLELENGHNYIADTGIINDDGTDPMVTKLKTADSVEILHYFGQSTRHEHYIFNGLKNCLKGYPPSSKVVTFSRILKNDTVEILNQGNYCPCELY